VTADALLDSNVLIAAVAEAHEHHGPSLDIFVAARGELAVTAHSYAEAYSTLTRQGRHGPFGFSADEAWAALESVRSVTMLVGLTAGQTFDTVRSYARSGGIGPRLYDRLIGHAAVIHEIPVVVTWSVAHMRSLFPQLSIVTPKDLAQPTALRRP
jgi:predicted nucleic acid-binding protein